MGGPLNSLGHRKRGLPWVQPAAMYNLHRDTWDLPSPDGTAPIASRCFGHRDQHWGNEEARAAGLLSAQQQGRRDSPRLASIAIEKKKTQGSICKIRTPGGGGETPVVTLTPLVNQGGFLERRCLNSGASWGADGRLLCSRRWLCLESKGSPLPTGKTPPSTPPWAKSGRLCKGPEGLFWAVLAAVGGAASAEFHKGIPGGDAISTPHLCIFKQSI